MNTPKNGRFVWHELMTTDVQAAIKFYKELFGWTTRDSGMPGYTLIAAGGRDIGGFMATKPADKIPSYWAGYIATDSVDGVADRAQSLGGKLLVPPTDIPNVGRFALLTDGQGAVFAPLALKEMPPEIESGKAPLGIFCWDELMTTDTASAKTFYATLFQLTTESMDMGPMGTYTMFKRGDKQTAGMLTLPEEAKAMGAKPHWLSYVLVADTDATTAKAKGFGAKVLVEPKDVANMGRFSVLQDPEGAVFALWKPTTK